MPFLNRASAFARMSDVTGKGEEDFGMERNRVTEGVGANLDRSPNQPTGVWCWSQCWVTPSRGNPRLRVGSVQA